MKTCHEFAERNSYKVIGEYIDRAISGTAADNRPEFQRMIADSATRQFSAVIVYQLDRFARNRYDSANNKSKLKKNGVKVLSAKENISDDASGVLLESVLESVACQGLFSNRYLKSVKVSVPQSAKQKKMKASRETC
jgi:DNA invertase Pin-like site-specific DNA recombinase